MVLMGYQMVVFLLPSRVQLFSKLDLDSSTPFFDSDSSISFFDSQAHSTTTNIRLFRYGFIFGRESASARKPSPHSSIDNFLASLYCQSAYALSILFWPVLFP
ncbi:unnamed protein product [Ilex paraguariensis]|uniref:Uncharacterized protein n=1 Tax=Ilex paraguariensis TaxID=185542 RepID=A0ABC8SUI6_9AQUA